MMEGRRGGMHQDVSFLLLSFLFPHLFSSFPFFKILFSFFLNLVLYWSIVDLQCCVSFRCTADDSVIHVHTPILFQILFPDRLLQKIELSSLCYTVGPC